MTTTTVEFTRMADGTRDEYQYLHGLEHEYISELPERLIEALRRLDDGLERALLAPQLLGPLRLVPDVRVLECGVDLVQPQRFAVVVKDTPGGRWCASSGRRGGCQWH